MDLLVFFYWFAVLYYREDRVWPSQRLFTYIDQNHKILKRCNFGRQHNFHFVYCKVNTMQIPCILLKIWVKQKYLIMGIRELFWYFHVLVLDSSLTGYHMQIELPRNTILVLSVLLISDYEMIWVFFWRGYKWTYVDLLRILYWLAVFLSLKNWCAWVPEASEHLKSLSRYLGYLGEQNRHADHLSPERNLYDNKQDTEGSQLGFSACLSIASRNNSVQEYLVSKCYPTWTRIV